MDQLIDTIVLLAGCYICLNHCNCQLPRLKASLASALKQMDGGRAHSFDTDTPAEKTLKVLKALMYGDNVGFIPYVWIDLKSVGNVALMFEARILTTLIHVAVYHHHPSALSMAKC